MTEETTRHSTLRPDTVHHIRVVVNGKEYESAVEPRLLLVHYVRDVLRLTGTHIGCDTTNCGACTVLFNGKSVKSCTIFAVQASGGEITTIEGLAGDGALHPIQKAFLENRGLQCGYCTPGMIMQTFWLLREDPKLTDVEIRKKISGNLCRCTGYQSIVASIKSAMQEINGK